MATAPPPYDPTQLGNVWISCPEVAARYAQPPGFVAVPFNDWQALFDAGEAQKCDGADDTFWEIGDCSHIVPPPEPPPPEPAPSPAARSRRAPAPNEGTS